MIQEPFSKKFSNVEQEKTMRTFLVDEDTLFERRRDVNKVNRFVRQVKTLLERALVTPSHPPPPPTIINALTSLRLFKSSICIYVPLTLNLLYLSYFVFIFIFLTVGPNHVRLSLLLHHLNIFIDDIRENVLCNFHIKNTISSEITCRSLDTNELNINDLITSLGWFKRTEPF